MEDGEVKTYYIRRPRKDDLVKHTRLRETEDTSESEPDESHPKGDDATGSGKKGSRQRKGLVREDDSDNPLSEGRPPPDLEPTAADDEEVSIVDLEGAKEISLYGREEATRPEISRDLFILRLLEGRASLRGPEFSKDCEFIRRVWFPTQAQLATGQRRKEKNAPPVVRKRHDWIDDSWDDDTDEEEAARALKNKIPDSELIDESEDDDVGHDLQLNQITPKLAGSVNNSQLRVVGRVTAPNDRGRTRATLVHGPPGTGKTTTITAAAIRLINAGEPVWIIAHSNVGISNVAEKLVKIGYTDFILIVAQEFFGWW